MPSGVRSKRPLLPPAQSLFPLFSFRYGLSPEPSARPAGSWGCSPGIQPSAASGMSSQLGLIQAQLPLGLWDGPLRSQAQAVLPCCPVTLSQGLAPSDHPHPPQPAPGSLRGAEAHPFHPEPRILSPLSLSVSLSWPNRVSGTWRVPGVRRVVTGATRDACCFISASPWSPLRGLMG